MRTQRTRSDAGTSTAVGLAIIVVLCVAIPLGIWGLTVVLSPMFGAGETVKTRESSVNRVTATQTFRDNYADYTATLAKIPSAAKSAALPGAQPEVQVRLDGLRQHCADVAEEYNADGGSLTKAKWRPAELPETLDSAACLA